MDRNMIKLQIEQNKIAVTTQIDLENNKIKYASDVYQFSNITKLTDEELTRATLISRLVNLYQYPLERIEIEHPYTVGRKGTKAKRADLIVRDEDGDAFLFVEIKSPSGYESEDTNTILQEQLFKVAALEETEGKKVHYMMLYTISEQDGGIADECIIIDREKYKNFIEWSETQSYVNTIPSNYGKALRTPYKRLGERDLLHHYSSEMLDKLQKELHNLLWAGGSTDDNDIFSSLVNLILAKIQDEDSVEIGDTYKFQLLTYKDKNGEEVFESDDAVFDRINLLYREALKSKMYIRDEKILQKSYVVDLNKFPANKLRIAVQKLEKYSFVDGKNSLKGKDILGDFFEGIIRTGFKQTKGQFFTHTNIVKFMLWGMQLDKLAISEIKNNATLPYMIDPSAGSGTFLIEYMKFITENMKYRFRNELGTTRLVQDKINSDWFYPNERENKWAQTYIYGSEFNFNLGTSTKVNMILHGDGQTNIFVKDGLLDFSEYQKEESHNVLHDNAEDETYEGKQVNERFDVILTNPPFSVSLDSKTKMSLKDRFIFFDKQTSQNLFIERYYQLLKEKGRLGVVLPESVFDTDSNTYIRLFLYKYFNVKAVVSLPQITFQPFTPTKTSILFAQKKTKDEIKEWDNLWNKFSSEYTQLKTQVNNLVAVYNGEKDREKLPSISNLSNSQEYEIFCKFLKTVDIPKEFSTEEIITSFEKEIQSMSQIDENLKEISKYVNAWWVFDEVVKEFDYDIFLADVENIGYKRTKRGEKETQNDLYSIEYAPSELDTEQILKEIIDNQERVNAQIENLNKKLIKTSSKNQKIKLSEQISMLKEKLKLIVEKYKRMDEFFNLYYENKLLKSKYQERTDENLIGMFKGGELSEYASEQVLIRKTVKREVLDYIREINWE